MLKINKKSVLGAAMVLLLSTTVVIAQPYQSDLKDITVETMFAYASQLHDRGDALGAQEVARRILQINPDHSGAQSYLGKKASVQETATIKVSKVIKEETPKLAEVNKPVIKEEIIVKPVAPTPVVVAAPVVTNADLKSFLQQKQAALAQLRSQINTLKQDLSSMNNIQ